MQSTGVNRVAAWILGAGLVATGASADAQGSCREPEVIASFVSGQDIPESVTTDDAGNLYVTNGSAILRRPRGGVFETYATLPLPIFALGVKVGPDGCVYTASTSLSEVAGAFVWRSCAPGSIEVFVELDHAGTPNDLAFDRAGNAFVTDPRLGRIWKVTPGGTASVFVDHPLLDGDPVDPALLFAPLGVNGIAFDKHGRSLFVSNTDQGTVLEIDLRVGSPEPEIFAENELLRGADGIAFDRGQRLFVAVNATDTLVSINRGGQIRVVETGAPLDGPSSVVFGATHDDRHALYLTSSAFSRTLGLQPGTPAPALLALRVSTPGLPLE